MLKKINLDSFGIHKSLEINFQPGINALIGANRTGKTHIMEGICFGLHGKTQNSKLEKIINFDSNKATVDLSLTEFNVSRSRTNSGSVLSGIKKLELENFLHLNYQEFLSIFYISSHEQKSLFDPTYLRQFLISIFNLDKYSTIYQRLKVEYAGLSAVNVEIKAVNLPLIKKRFVKVKGLCSGYKKNLEKYEIIDNKIRSILNQISKKESEYSFKKQGLKKEFALLKSGKCSECARPYDKKHIEAGLKRVKTVFKAIQQQEAILTKKQKEVGIKSTKCNKIMGKIDSKINRARRILVILQERAKQQPTVNKVRLKELEQLIPIFDPKGFPSYLLKTYIPVITQTANQLLSIIFPDTIVDIRTERPESNRPDFKPFIHRGDKILEMGDLSGSERVLVNLCFRLGIMVIFKQLCNTCIDFMLIDEGLEKVDDDNCLKVLSLFENFMDMGFLKQVIMVTHKDVLKTQDQVHYVELHKIGE